MLLACQRPPLPCLFNTRLIASPFPLFSAHRSKIRNRAFIKLKTDVVHYSNHISDYPPRLASFSKPTKATYFMLFALDPSSESAVALHIPFLVSQPLAFSELALVNLGVVYDA